MSHMLASADIGSDTDSDSEYLDEDGTGGIYLISGVSKFLPSKIDRVKKYNQ